MKSPKPTGPSAEEKELERTSVAQWNDYVGRFRPAEAELIRRAQLTEGERASVKGQASADAAGAFKGLTRDTIAASKGKVQSGKTKLALAGDATSAGRATGLAAAAAETGAEQDRDEQQLGIAATGRNIAHDATSNLARGAQRRTSLNLAASQARFERNANTVNALSAVAGAAARKFGDPYGDKKRRSFDQEELTEVHVPPRPRRGAIDNFPTFDPNLTGGLA